MIPVALLAQTLLSTSSGVDWLYQFANNLTNLTTQNGGALTQLGLTELSCISLFTLISMVVNWNTTSMTLRFHAQPVHAGDLVTFLVRLIVCCLLESYWVNPPVRLRHQPFSRTLRRRGCTFDQNSLDQLPTAQDAGITPPCRLTAPIQILCYFLVQILLGLASAILLIIIARIHLYGVTALFGQFSSVTDDKNISGKFFHFLDVLVVSP